ncbi:MAG: DUF2163 domain-containing protein [Magnetococcus sp. DMHC-8]
MSGRGASSSFLAAITQPGVVCCHLVEARMDDGTVRMTDFCRDVAWGGNTYLALGRFLSFEPVEESLDIAATQLTVVLSGVDSSNLALFLDDAYLFRQWLIYKAVFDATGAMISDPVLMFDGRVGRVTSSEDPEAGSCQISITLANSWVMFGQTAGRHTNDAEQQLHFPGDRGFEFVASLASNQNIPWGRPK